MAIGYDTRGRRDREYQQPLPDYRMQERVAWQALQEVAQRLLVESARRPSPPRRFSTLLAYAQAQRAWRGARYALDLAAVPLPRRGEVVAVPRVQFRRPRVARQRSR